MPRLQVRGTERTSATLIGNLRELPSREALALRAQAASQVRPIDRCDTNTLTSSSLFDKGVRNPKVLTVSQRLSEPSGL